MKQIYIKKNINMKKYNLGLHIFTRDLRIVDNNTLEKANELCDKIIPCFIFTKSQTSDELNKFKSNKSLQFMIESLDDLNNAIQKQNSQLHIYYGILENVIEELIKKTKVQTIFITRDYTPYSNERELLIEQLCFKYNLTFYCIDDYLLYQHPEYTNKYYKKFTPYYNYQLKNKVNPFIKKHKINFKKIVLDDNKYTFSLKTAYIKLIEPSYKSIFTGGRKEGLKILNSIKNFENYGDTRNDLTKNTTGLSAYMKFGCISPREVYYIMKNNLGINHDLIKQLIWREFYLQLLISHPYVLKGKSLKPNYDNIIWKNNMSLFKKWCDGKTGFPIVDAGIREMNETGFMHNRARLITASFLVKNLLIDWRFGEKYFATKLIDYDPASNNGNWQWVAGSGADSMPYFRIFNPWTQGKNYDKNCIYIKKWIPELNDVEPNDIHNWFNIKNRSKYTDIKYYEPIIDYSKSRTETLELYKKYLNP
jgi:deoxyribodipyrimidine photo-lyase